jgi:hypothetical protein
MCTLTDTKKAMEPLALIKPVQKQAQIIKTQIVSKLKGFFNPKGQAREKERAQKEEQAAHKLRKQADNLLDMQNLKTKDVTVVVRVRPSTASHQQGRIRALETYGASLALYNGNCQRQDATDNSWGTPRVFTFDAVVPESSKTEEIFPLIGSSAVMEVCRGVNALVLAFGQTGSGKTYTLLGDSEDLRAPSVATMTFMHLRRELDKQEGLGKGKNSFAFSIQVSAVQIYLNHVHDLLSQNDVAVRIRTHKKETIASLLGGCQLCELEPKETCKMCNDVDEFQSILEHIFLKRMQNKTNMNEKSSRSHLVLTLTVRRTMNTRQGAKGTHHLIKSRNHEEEVMSKLVLVDLAGNERDFARNGLSDEADRKKEGIAINLSLSALSACLRERMANSSKINKQQEGGNEKTGTRKSAAGLYRRSTLTRLLREHLMSAKIFFLACCSPDASYAATTGQTLQYAAIVKHIKTTAEDTALLLEQNPDNIPIEFLPYKVLVDCPRIVRSSEHKTVYLHELRVDVVRVMVSHRWLSSSFNPCCAHPDDQENHKLLLLRELFGRMCAHGWIRSSDQLHIACWIDYGECAG